MHATKQTMHAASTSAARTIGFLELAFDDYRAARLLIRQGLLTQGVALCSTAIEKQLKALLSLKNIYTKDHLTPRLASLVCQHYPAVADVLDRDFIKFLTKAYDIRYAIADKEGFNIVINQHRTLIFLDITMLAIDSGFKPTLDGEQSKTPISRAIEDQHSIIVDDNVVLNAESRRELDERRNLMLELRVGKRFQVLTARYETEGLNILGSMCKATDIDFGKEEWQLALG
jgi:HEPN domain-containing protein